jgi:hypothetical protein
LSAEPAALPWLGIVEAGGAEAAAETRRSQEYRQNPKTSSVEAADDIRCLL